MTDLFPTIEAPTDPRAVPHSRESEEAVCGSVLINPESYYDCAAFLRADDFYIHRHKWIWDVYDALVDKRQPIDLLTVSDELDRRGQLAEIGGPAYLTSLASQVPSSLNAESYGRIVQGYAVRRKMITAANRIATLAYSDHMELDNVINQTWTEVENAVETSLYKAGMRRISDVLSESYDRLDEMSNMSDEDKPIIRTGLIDLDKILKIRKKQLITIAARPGIGKSALADTIAIYATKHQKKTVAFFSLEMGDDEIGDRLISQESDVNLSHILDAKMDERDWAPYVHAVEALSAGNLFVNDDADINVPQIRAECKKLKARYGLDLVIVDYGGLIDAPGSNANERSSYVTRSLKKLSKALDVPVLMLWQMNRGIEARADGKPILSDLRDSGSVEQDSDTVVFLYIKDEINPRAEVNHINGAVSKQRNGPTGDFTLARRTVTTKFENATVIYS